MDTLAPPVQSPLPVPRRLLRLRSDAALAERFAAGDEAAFAVLYERHRPSVLAVCMGVLGSSHDAEDATQDAFASLAVSLRDRPPRELRPWLARVARNAAIDVARRRRSACAAGDEVPDIAAGGSGVKAELDVVLAGIRELPETQRTALLMREVAGHSYVEIAGLLEVDEDAVRGLIARARVGLRAHREAAELTCTTARAALAAEPDGRASDRTIRRHVRGCASCRAYRQALRRDARALRSIVPGPAGGIAGGGAIFGGLAAKGALLGGALTQVTAACAVSACAVGGVVLFYPHPRASTAIVHRHLPMTGRAESGAGSSGLAGGTGEAVVATRSATAPGGSAATGSLAHHAVRGATTRASSAGPSAVQLRHRHPSGRWLITRPRLGGPDRPRSGGGDRFFGPGPASPGSERPHVAAGGGDRAGQSGPGPDLQPSLTQQAGGDGQSGSRPGSGNSSADRSGQSGAVSSATGPGTDNSAVSGSGQEGSQASGDQRGAAGKPHSSGDPGAGAGKPHSSGD
jgi:RNA polymerase sigma factor (sigma-70 family)